MAYVCICNPTTEDQVVRKIQLSKTEEQVKQELNICKWCKTCSSEINRLFCLIKK